MPKPRTYQTEAVIIKKVKLGEADRILTLYTPHLGKIQGVAKGVRRPRSKLAGHLELLTHSQVSLARGRNLDTIIGSQTIDSFLPLKSDLWLISCALYVTELVNQFTADHNENSSLFKLLLETMCRLCQADDNKMVLHYFELHLLNESGYRPQLDQCASCRSQLESVTTSAFSPADGGVLCSSCNQRRSLTYRVSADTLKLMRLLQSDDYSSGIQLEMNPKSSHELDNIMSRYIEYLLERQVKSAAWLDVLREQIKEKST
ncbi:DNA repair protein RecO [Chloroflexota bacterium]